MNKTERAKIELLLQHAAKDMDFAWNGSYGGHDEDDKKANAEMLRNIKKGRDAIEIVRWIINEGSFSN